MTLHIAGWKVADLAAEFGTPVYTYEQDIIKQRIAEARCFPLVRFAQKACSNLSILKLVREEGCVVDAVSAGEVYRALWAGYDPNPAKREIVYTADIFDADALQVISKYKIPVNAGSPDMLGQLAAISTDIPVILRINPGFGHGHNRKVNTGGELSKHGIWHQALPECLRMAKDLGLNVIGLHMHIGSGSDFDHLAQVADTMVKMAVTIPQLKLISAGGGIPIPYRDETHIDWKAYLRIWNKAKEDVQKALGHEVELELEPGRYIVAESGKLISEIRAIKRNRNTTFYLVDAGFDNLIRPAMYGAYHKITVAPAAGRELGPGQEVVVAGPLCESGDVFTQEEGGFVGSRVLPKAQVGDFLVIHDTGAYGSVMGSNYNTRRAAPEVMLDSKSKSLIRRRQEFRDLVALEDFPQDDLLQRR